MYFVTNYSLWQNYEQKNIRLCSQLLSFVYELGEKNNGKIWNSWDFNIKRLNYYWSEWVPFEKLLYIIYLLILQIQAANGDVTITNDGATILKQMQVLHPAAKMVNQFIGN